MFIRSGSRQTKSYSTPRQFAGTTRTTEALREIRRGLSFFAEPIKEARYESGKNSQHGWGLAIDIDWRQTDALDAFLYSLYLPPIVQSHKILRVGSGA